MKVAFYIALMLHPGHERVLCLHFSDQQIKEWRYTDTLEHFDHITFNLQWSCIHHDGLWGYICLCGGTVRHTHMHTTDKLFVCSPFPCSIPPSLSALHSVMDQRTCPKVLYRQHTCSLSLHADVTLQLQPCTVEVCVNIQRWLHRLCEGPPVDVWLCMLWHCVWIFQMGRPLLLPWTLVGMRRMTQCF